MRRIIQDIDARNWRTLDYYRILESRKRLQNTNDTVSANIVIENLH